MHWRKVNENHNNVIAEFSTSSGSNAIGDGSSTHGAWNSTAIFAIESQTDNANNCGQDGTTACLEVAIHRNVEKAIEENPSFEVIQSEPMSVSGMPAHQIVFLQTNGTEDSRNNKIDEIYVLDGDSGIQYAILFEADNHTYARNLLLLDKVIESISLSSTWLQQ